jgi:hypothetical protein
MTTDVRDDVLVVKTYRYLRCALVGLAGSLVAAIVVDQVREQDDWLGSMSGYYYTSARSWFVGALVGMGVCLVCLRGRTDREDLLLNVAGMLAPVVAFVPTTLPRGLGTGPELPPGSDVSLPPDVRETALSNVAVLCGLGVAGFLLLVVLALRGRSDDKRPAFSVAYALGAALVWAGVAFALAREQEWFLDNAHNYAATTMFAAIAVVVALNGLDREAGPRRLRLVYVGIASLMVLTALLLLLKGSWAHAILCVELAELSLFAIFWALQTGQHWGSAQPLPRREARPETITLPDAGAPGREVAEQQTRARS